jgi:hypothetical protein
LLAKTHVPSQQGSDASFPLCGQQKILVQHTAITLWAMVTTGNAMDTLNATTKKPMQIIAGTIKPELVGGARGWVRKRNEHQPANLPASHRGAKDNVMGGDRVVAPRPK